MIVAKETALIYREDCVLASTFANGWINVVVVPLPESGEVQVRVEFQEEFDEEARLIHTWTGKPTMAGLKEHYWRLGGSQAEKPGVFAAILRCVGKARAELKQASAV